MTNAIKINEADNIAVAIIPINKGESLTLDMGALVAAENILQGHKISLRDIKKGEKIIKYGFPIGYATQDIKKGCSVHVHNLKTGLSKQIKYSYSPEIIPITSIAPENFYGYLRPDGRAAIRNEIWIIPTVGCVNSVAERMVKLNQGLVKGSMEGIYAFPHPYGCSQMGDDHATTRKLLASLVNHPHAAGVLVLGLGCENNGIVGFKEELKHWDDKRVKFLICQEEENEFEKGTQLLSELAEYAGQFKRQLIPVSKLVVGMKCGGSDGLSGITANPTVGVFSDMLIARGGSTVLTEVPEMFGAEAVLMNRCINAEVYQKSVRMVNNFKQYFIDHNQVVYENPSPGNKDGGISTLEDKSLGCVQKGGRAPVSDVIDYGCQIKTQGLSLLVGPGNDLVSTTALTAAGANLILFTTGRGTPFGAPVPTVKIASNNLLTIKKSGWIDFNAGSIADGDPISNVAARLFQYVMNLASGKVFTKAEQNGYREIAIFKDGVVL